MFPTTHSYFKAGDLGQIWVRSIKIFTAGKPSEMQVTPAQYR